MVWSCSREQHLALALLEVGAGRLPDLAGEAQHAQPVLQELQHAVEAAVDVEGLQHLLLLGRADVHGAGDEVGEQSGRADAADGVRELARRLRQELDGLQRPLAQQHEACVDLGPVLLRLLEPLDPGGQERMAADIFQDPEALLALADQVVVAVRSRHVAQDRRHRADPVQVERVRVLDLLLALQDDADRALGTHGRLGRRDRARAAHGHREDGAGKEDDIAHRHQRQHVRRQRRRIAPRARRGHLDCFIRHRTSPAQASLRKVRVRQPSSRSRRPSS